MTGIVDRLIHLELVQRKSDPSDRRVILLELTASGTAALAGIEEKVQTMMHRFFESMPEEDRETSMRIFLKLKDFLKDEINAQKKT
jgi:DNA-binding MarR family transcriptional regulator